MTCLIFLQTSNQPKLSKLPYNCQRCNWLNLSWQHLFAIYNAVKVIFFVQILHQREMEYLNIFQNFNLVIFFDTERAKIHWKNVSWMGRHKFSLIHHLENSIVGNLESISKLSGLKVPPRVILGFILSYSALLARISNWNTQKTLFNSYDEKAKKLDFQAHPSIDSFKQNP